MKSPWQIGLLALAVTGVSAYDLLYFTHFRTNNQTSIQTAASPPLIAAAEPANATQVVPADSDYTAGAADAVSLPRISRENIQTLAQKAFVSKEDWKPETETVWPRRDPFLASREFAPASQNIPEPSSAKQTSAPQNVPEPSSAKQTSAPPPLPSPQCIFSGALIEQGRRLALVDGVPLSIGDRLGVWQLAQIEPDYIILEAGKETRRIEIKGSEPQTLRRKDPS
jgi:hypothetical protein